MPTILRQLVPMGPMHQLVHHPMAPSYHGAAKRHAAIARALAAAEGRTLDRAWKRLRPQLLRLPAPWRDLVPQPWDSERAEHAVLALIYAAMAIEARANESAEELLPFEDLDSFDRSRGKKFAAPDKESKPVWKWKLLFDRIESPVDLAEPFLEDVRQLFDDRNALLHFSLSRTATTIVHAPPREENGMVVMWDAHAPPTTVTESRLLSLFRAEGATRAERVMEELFSRWRVAARAWHERNLTRTARR